MVAPPRYRQKPTYPIWGRPLIATLSDDVRLIPGEAVTISLGTDQRHSATVGIKTRSRDERYDDR